VKKKVIVNRAFLNKLADNIYDPKTKDFLPLCKGTLQNGPDPYDGKRTLHCGLGELYFCMTGKQPEDAGVSEDEVVEKAIELSTLAGVKKKRMEAAKNALMKLDLPVSVRDELIGRIIENEEKFSNEDDDKAPDHNSGDNTTKVQYRQRSARVAKRLRIAADLLE
jgi:hypothetical protein